MLHELYSSDIEDNLLMEPLCYYWNFFIHDIE